MRQNAAFFSLVAASMLAGCQTATKSTPTASSTALADVASAPSPTPSASAHVAALPAAAASASAAAAALDTPPAPEGMVRIPAGFYVMGGNGLEDQPMHEVAVGAFFLDKTEVTMDAFKACVDAKKCAPPKNSNAFCNVNFPDRGKHPVNCIDYHQAEAYCAFQDKRVPTEREWEYAARGGSEQRLYSWGENDPTDKISCYMHPGGSCEVASFPPGAFGLYDMNGNLWEWTSTFFGPYPDEPASGTLRVYRGGSWSRRFPKWLRNDLRNRDTEHYDGAHLGVRCAKNITPLECPNESEAKDGHCVRNAGKPLDPTAIAAAKMARMESGGSSNGSGGAATPAGSSTSAATDATDNSWANSTPVKIRSPEFDEDCKHYQGYPVGYTWRGGKFQDREPIIAGSGCKKRDIGVGWTSVCCPS